MKKNIRSCRRERGAVIAESAAALALLLPTVIFITFAILEVGYAYLIKNSMAEGAREAARHLAVAYGQNHTVATDRSLQESKAFDKVRITNMIASSAQFDDPVFETAADPPMVSVTVRYTSGLNGLPTFPNPDPLYLGSAFAITHTATYRLQ
jgi:hypothetical protein